MKKKTALLLLLALFSKVPDSFPANDSSVKVKKFEFNGIKRTPQDQLKKISAKYISSPLFGNWPDQMIMEIKKIPIVKEAHLIRDLTGNVSIQIVEWSPFANLSLDQFYWMDELGKIIQAEESKSLESLVVFSGPWKNADDYRKRNGNEIIATGIRLYVSLVNEGFPEKKISEMHFDANSGWIMYRMESRAPVVFGTQNLSQKAQRFVQIVPHLDPFEGSILKIDTDFHDRVVVKLASSSGVVGK